MNSFSGEVYVSQLHVQQSIETRVTRSLVCTPVNQVHRYSNLVCSPAKQKSKSRGTSLHTRHSSRFYLL